MSNLANLATDLAKSDPKQHAKAARREYQPPREQTEGQLDLLEGIA